MTRAVVIGNATVYVIQRMGAPAIKQAAAAYAGAIAAAAAPEPPPMRRRVRIHEDIGSGERVSLIVLRGQGQVSKVVPAAILRVGPRIALR